MQRALAFNRSPPLNVSLGFFLNIPLFLLLASVALGWTAVSGSVYVRWNPFVLAAAHLFTLGVLASAMLGALIQILPVAAHIRVLRTRIISLAVQVCLTTGTLLLAGGFVTAKPLLHSLAAATLSVAFFLFIGAVARGLILDWENRSPGSAEILVAVRLALVALAMTIGLGLYMAGLRGMLWSTGLVQAGAWLQNLPNLHVAWGLAGWIGLLVIGVSFQLIPIFQATEIYPSRVTDMLAPTVFVSLVTLTLAGSWHGASTDVPFQAQKWATTILALALLTYSVVTFWLLWTRKRPKPEPTTLFWLASMTALFLASLVGFLRIWVPNLAPDALDMLIGTLLLPGFAVSAVNGMLYKIIPFLLWHNAQRRSPIALAFIPKVKQYISESAARRQFYAHFCALLLLCISCLETQFLLFAALAFGASALLLGWNMWLAVSLYLHTCKRIEATLSAPQSQATS